MTTTATVNTNNAAQQFEEQGFVILPRLLNAEVVAGVRREMEGWVDRLALQLVEESINEALYENEPFDTRLIRIIENCPDRMVREIRSELHLPGMFGLFFDPRLLDLVETLLGPEIRLYPNYTVRPKLPEMALTQVPWHQDAALTAAGHHGSDPDSGDLTVEQLRMINVWSPLVPAQKENGCMQFISATHKLGIVAHEEKDFGYMEIAEAELKPRLKDAIDIELDPGDVVLFSNLLFHVGQPNQAKTIRWSCDWRYQDATQSTMRTEKGHLARSQSNPDSTVRGAEHWATLSLHSA